MLYNLHYNAYGCMVTLDSRFVATVIGSCLRTIVVAYHEFHTHSKTLHQQVTMACNDQSIQLV